MVFDWSIWRMGKLRYVVGHHWMCHFMCIWELVCCYAWLRMDKNVCFFVTGFLCLDKAHAVSKNRQIVLDSTVEVQEQVL